MSQPGPWQPQPPAAPQWTPPGPPRRGNRTVLWVSLGSAALAVVCVLALAGLYASGVIGPDSSEDGDGAAAPEQSPTANHALVADLCARLDTSAFDSFGEHRDRDNEAEADEGPLGRVSCPQTFLDGGSPQGTLYVTAYYESDGPAAEQWWRDMHGDLNERVDHSDATVKGIGESSGYTAYGADQGQQDWHVLTLHDNLVVHTWFSWWGEPAGEDEVADKMFEFAQGTQSLAEGG